MMLRHVIAGTLLLSQFACRGDIYDTVRATGGDPERGAEAIRKYGCDTCHIIPGIRGPAAHVGPPLNAIAQRTFLAGELPNTPMNMQNWIRDPRATEPRTAMPNVGVTEADARDIAAYLYTLR